MYQPTRDAMEAILCEIAWTLAPLLRSTWSDLPRVVPGVLFVSRSVRCAILKHTQGTLAYYSCSTLTYELRVHSTIPRQPGRVPQMPLHWVVLSDEHEHTMHGSVTTLWYRSHDNSLRVHEDAWDVMPSLHDGSMGPYDFDTLLIFLNMGSMAKFYRYDIAPILRVVNLLKEGNDRYHLFTYQRCIQQLSLVPIKKNKSWSCSRCPTLSSSSALTTSRPPRSIASP